MKSPDIIGVSAKNSGMWRTGAKTGSDSSMQFAYETIDENYLPLMKIPLVQGRNFSTAFPADSNNSVIVNESFVKKAGWKHPIGEIVNFFYNNNEIYHVVGVVKDYHFASLNEKIIPQLFTMKNDNLYGTYYIKIKPNTQTASLKMIQKTFKQLYPLSPYSYVFKNDQNIREYEAVAKWKQIHFIWRYTHHFYFMHWLVWLISFISRKKNKGNWNPQSAGSICKKYCYHSFY